METSLSKKYIWNVHVNQGCDHNIFPKRNIQSTFRIFRAAWWSFAVSLWQPLARLTTRSPKPDKHWRKSGELYEAWLLIFCRNSFAALKPNRIDSSMTTIFHIFRPVCHLQAPPYIPPYISAIDLQYLQWCSAWVRNCWALKSVPAVQSLK